MKSRDISWLFYICRKTKEFEGKLFFKICIIWLLKDKLQYGGVHMDKKSKNKVSNFFKKEGFYVILFVCVCIVATVAAITVRNNRTIKSKAPVAIKTNQTKQVQNNSQAKTQIPSNATQVQQNKNNEKQKTAESEAAATSPSVQTSAKPALSFTKPVSGNLLLGFSDLAEIEPSDSKTIQSMETINGMYISCKIGQDVFASESGVVVENNTADNFGQVVTIKHENGYKTVYGNLAEKPNVKVGDKVSKGQKIGSIGKTSNHYPSYKALNDGFLYFQILKNEVPIDPVSCNIKY